MVHTDMLFTLVIIVGQTPEATVGRIVAYIALLFFIVKILKSFI